MSTTMFSWRNKKNINIFVEKKKNSLIWSYDIFYSKHQQFHLHQVCQLQVRRVSISDQQEWWIRQFEMWHNLTNTKTHIKVSQTIPNIFSSHLCCCYFIFTFLGPKCAPLPHPPPPTIPPKTIFISFNDQFLWKQGWFYGQRACKERIFRGLSARLA